MQNRSQQTQNLKRGFETETYKAVSKKQKKRCTHVEHIYSLFLVMSFISAYIHNNKITDIIMSSRCIDVDQWQQLGYILLFISTKKLN